MKLGFDWPSCFGRANKNPYRHDRRADKNPYRHDRSADSQCQRKKEGVVYRSGEPRKITIVNYRLNE